MLRLALHVSVGHRPAAPPKRIPGEWIFVVGLVFAAQTNEGVVREMARCLRKIGDGRPPK